MSAPTSQDEVIVDLSTPEVLNALLDYQDVCTLLSDEQERKLVDYVRNCIQLSHNSIERRYQYWDEADKAHDVYVDPSATNFREKVVIADTRAIADTVLTYLMAALAGRNPMFQLEGLNRKSKQPAAILERVLHQHTRRNAGEARIAQLLLDSIRYGYAPTKVVWHPKKKTNVVVNWEPRRTFPDPRVRWGDWDAMSFIVFSDIASTQSLMASGMYPRIKADPDIRRYRNTVGGWAGHQTFKHEGKGWSIDQSAPVATAGDTGTTNFFNLGRARVIDEAWIRLQGYEVGIPQIDEIWLVAAILDEKFCVRLQLNPNGRQFPCVIGGLFNDAHKSFSQSLYDLLMPMHELSTWLLRSRIDNVQAALNNMIFADPTAVSLYDIMNRNPWGLIRTMPGHKPGDGVFIAQVPDVTRGHWSDISMLTEKMQRLSAASDAQQGMPTADGIRSATEIQRLTQLGSQRLGVLARIISATTIRPKIRMEVQNLQDAISLEGSIRLDERQAPNSLISQLKDGYIDYNVADLQGDIEYLVVDGTLPVEPTRNAEVWLNAIQILNQTGLALEYDSGRMVEEAIRAMGLADVDSFKIGKERQEQGPTPSQQLLMLEKMRGANQEVMPQEQLMRQVERGNLAPMKEVQ